MKRNIAVICGGSSSEYEVSVKSGRNIYDAIDGERYGKFLMIMKGREWNVIIGDTPVPVDKNDFSCTVGDEKIVFDFAYITIHGVPGENGHLQGYLEMMGIPYSTSGVLAEAITFDKYTCTAFLNGMGIDTTSPLLLRRGEIYDTAKIAEETGFPCFVKPSGEGSSFGVTKVRSMEELQPAINLAFSKCSDVVVEPMVEGREFTCGLYKAGTKKVIFPVAEVVSQNEFFDYEAKYAGKSSEIIPAPFPDEITERIQNMAGEVYDILGCRGIVRVDGFFSGDRVIMLEVNTTPGMTAQSFIPQMVRAAGLSLTEVLSEIIESACAPRT